MEQNKYHQAIEQIKTPNELREHTRSRLVAETTKRKNSWVVWGLPAIAAAFVLIFGVSIWLMNTQLGRLGTHPNIDLNFVAISEDLSPVRMALTYPLRQNIQLDRMPGTLPPESPEGFSPPAGDITVYFSEPSEPPEAILGNAVYRSKDGGQITVVFSDTSMIYFPFEVLDSYIEDFQVGVAYSESDGKYYAIFKKSALTYLLTTEGMDKDAFTQVLVHFVLS